MNRLFAILTFGPILLWGLAIITGVALLGGEDCVINEAQVNPCIVFGHDIGTFATTLGLYAAWGPLNFGPFVAAAGVLWVLVAVIRAMAKRKS